MSKVVTASGLCVGSGSRLGSLQPPGPGAWYPDQISGLEIFFDYKDISGSLAPQHFTKDGSNNISQWNDLSGNSRHATAVINYPVYTASGVQFAAASSNKFTFSNDQLVGTAQDFTIFFAIQATSVSGFNGLFVFSAGGTDGYTIGLSTNGGYSNMYLDSFIANIDSAHSGKPNLAFSNLTSLHNFIVTSANGGSVVYYVDGSTVAASTGSPRANAATGIMGYDTNGYYDGYIRTFGIYNSVLSGSSLTSLKAFLAARST